MTNETFEKELKLLQDRLARSDEALSVARSNESAAARRLQESLGEVQRLGLLCARYANEVEAAKASAERSQVRADQAEASEREVRASAERLRKNEAELLTSLDAMKNQMSGLTEANKALREELERLQRELSTCEAQSKRHQTVAAEAARELAATKEALAKEKRVASTEAAQRTHIRGKYNDLLKTNQALQRELDERRTAEAERQRLQTVVEELRTKADDVGARLSAVTAERDKLALDLQTATDERTKMGRCCDELREELATLRSAPDRSLARLTRFLAAASKYPSVYAQIRKELECDSRS